MDVVFEIGPGVEADKDVNEALTPVALNLLDSPSDALGR
jgi:hypothetical protein